MNNGKRITIILVAIVVTLALLGAGQFFWQRFAIDQPLAREMHNIDGVDTFTVENSNKINDIVKLHVYLSHVKNLQKTYQAVSDSVTRILGSKQTSITISDNRTPELEQFYYDIHYYVQEAIATGNFLSMAEKIQQKSVNVGIKTQVYVDYANIYLSFSKDDAEMYVVVPRLTARPEVK